MTSVRRDAAILPELEHKPTRVLTSGHRKQAQAAAERATREAVEQEAKALENYHGPRWWEAALA